MSSHEWIERPVHSDHPQLTCKMCKNCEVPFYGPHTEECCQRPLTDWEQSRLRQKLLDYKEGKWRNYVDMRVR